MRAHHFMRHSVHSQKEAWDELKQAVEIAGLFSGAILAGAAAVVLLWHWLSGIGTSYASFF